MTTRARQLLLWHIAELDALLKRCPEDSISHDTVKARLEEAKNAFR